MAGTKHLTGVDEMIRKNRATCLPSYYRRMVNMRLVGYTGGKFGAGLMYVVKVTYVSGKTTWGVSDAMGLALFGPGRDGRLKANEFARSILAEYGRPIPEGVTVYSDGSRWLGGKVVAA